MSFNLNTFLPYRLSVVANRISQQLAQVYQKNHNLDIPQWRVLAILANGLDRMTATQVAQAASMDKVRISRTMARLRHKGLVEEKACLDDGRARRYQLTVAGRALYDAVLPAVRTCESRLFSCFDAEETRELHRLLDKLSAHLDSWQ